MCCSKCGKELSDTAKFCSSCGSPVNEINSTVKENVKFENESVKTDKKPKNIIKSIAELAMSLIVIYLLILGGAKIIDRYFPSKEGALDITDNSDIVKNTVDPLINLTDISFGDYGLEFEFENISDRDIAYIEFETYFYDNMGRFTGKQTFEYTGPLYKGKQDSLSYTIVSSINSDTGVVYPKNIKITFFDDKSITFVNTLYAYSNNFYGGELKDEE